MYMYVYVCVCIFFIRTLPTKRLPYFTSFFLLSSMFSNLSLQTDLMSGFSLPSQPGTWDLVVLGNEDMGAKGGLHLVVQEFSHNCPVDILR